MKKTGSHFPWPSSLFSKAGLILLAVLAWGALPSTVHAINVSAVYSSACQRDIGIIIEVDNAKIRLLTLDGAIKRIDRFNIIYMAYYPVGDNPVARVLFSEDAGLTVIKTVYKGQVVDLVKGWMIDAAEDRISFLTLKGNETVLDNKDIWDIDRVPMTGEIHFPGAAQQTYRFVHPYPFMTCNNISGPSASEPLIYPQHLLEDPILIKKELDRLKEGYERLKGFQADKVFYAKPQVYGNDARLGVWGNIGSRYGASRQRNNNFIPEIISEYSSGPFGFQHILVTGNALLPTGVHEEPQMQFYYGLKADYIHFAIMVDFNRYVIGQSKYRWHAEDLLENDHRDNDTFNVAGGFDYGSFAIDLSLWNRIQYSVRVGEQFHENSINLNKGGLIFENRAFKAELYYGFGDDKKKDLLPIPDGANEGERAYIEWINAQRAKQPEFFTDYLLYRLNLTFFSLSPFNPRYSLIYRAIDFSRRPNPDGIGAFKYRGSSLTNALYIEYPLDDEIRLSGYLSLELLDHRYGLEALDDSASHLFPKGGLNIALIF
ncbi:hypothetical protein KKI24_08120 [bacterium]|nr:hypothetical protein [bacterium]